MRLLVMLCLVLASCASFAFGQHSKKPTEPKNPELKIRIIPSKGTYFLYEKVFTKTEFTNITDKTLCFPEPSQGIAFTAKGYLRTHGAVLNASSRDRKDTDEQDEFIDRYCGWSISHDDLLRQIDLFWVKLGPNQVYVAKSSKASVKLTELGLWQLGATYYPPQCSFGDCKGYLQSEAHTFGCTVPRVLVNSEPVEVNVIPASEQK